MSPKTAADLSLLLVEISAPGQTLFVLLYGFSPWYRSLLGQGLFIKALSVMLLLDLSVLSYYWHELSPWVGPVVLLLVAVGVYLQLAALIWIRVQRWRERRQRRVEA